MKTTIKLGGLLKALRSTRDRVDRVAEGLRDVDDRAHDAADNAEDFATSTRAALSRVHREVNRVDHRVETVDREVAGVEQQAVLDRLAVGGVRNEVLEAVRQSAAAQQQSLDVNPACDLDT